MRDIKMIGMVMVISIAFLGCKDVEERIPADLSVLYDTTSAVVDQYEGQQAGGGKMVKKEMVKFTNASASEYEDGAMLHFTDSLGEVDVVVESLGLPDDWMKYKYLKFKMQNMNPFDVMVVFNIYGARNRLPQKIDLSPGGIYEGEMFLADLPLTARNKDIYSPNSIHIKASAFNSGFDLVLSDIELIKTSDTLPLPVVDPFGQRIRGEWSRKVDNLEQFHASLEKEKEYIDSLPGHDHMDHHGAWKEGKQFEASGFFRVQKDDGKWWLITPDGKPFWSLGVTGVRTKHNLADVTIFADRKYLFEELPDPEKFPNAYEADTCVSFYSWNIQRKYGDKEGWKKMAFKRLRSWGMNTIGNWSDLSLLKDSDMPYTHSFRVTERKGLYLKERIADVFDPEWQKFADSVMSEAAEFKDDPMLLGYFVDNEGGWGHLNLLEISPDDVPLRYEWEKLMREKYQSVDDINHAWGTELADWAAVRNLNSEEIADNDAFREDEVLLETHYAKQYFSFISKTLKKYDPNHMYLSCRFTRKLKPDHILEQAGKYCDVLTVNVYALAPIKEQMDAWYEKTGRPILIGEHHLPLRSERQLPPKYQAFTPDERLKYYQEYVKTWAGMPYSVGCHWYQYVDQHITGREMDGENQTVGLVDITDQPYDEMRKAISLSSKVMYQLHDKAE